MKIALASRNYHGQWKLLWPVSESVTQSPAAGVLQLQVGQYICNGHGYHCNIIHRHRHHRHRFKKGSPRVAPLESKRKPYLDWNEHNTSILYLALLASWKFQWNLQWIVLSCDQQDGGLKMYTGHDHDHDDHDDDYDDGDDDEERQMVWHCLCVSNWLTQ